MGTDKDKKNKYKLFDARYLVMLAVMTALAVAGRVAFMWLPFFKPMAGIATISGMAFGPVGGLICGAISMLVSNIFFGQGPWTIFQMLAYGVIGLVAGFMARAGWLSVKNIKRILLSAVISFVLVFVASTVILDTSSVYLMSFYTTKLQVLAIYINGIYPNAMNSLATAITVFILSKPVLSVIERIRKKYSI